MKKIIFTAILIFITSNIFSQSLLTKTSLTGLFTYKMPADWVEERKTHPSVVEYVQYISSNGEYLMLSISDVYNTVLSSIERTKYSRTDLSYNLYSDASRKAAFDGFIKTYIGTLTYKALKVLESRIELVNGIYSNYVLFSYISSDGNQKNQLNYEFLFNGYSIKFSYGYIFKRETISLPVIQDLIKTIAFKK